MVTIVFVVMLVVLLVGFVVFKISFSGGRKNQGAQSQVNAQRQEPEASRGTGAGDN